MEGRMIDWFTAGNIALQLIILAFMLVGLLGLAIPIFPGIAIIWLSSLVYAIIQAAAGRMDTWDWVIFGLITLLMVVGSFIDNIIYAKKLRETGTTWLSIGISTFAGLVSSLFLTPIAALLITPLALFLAEYARLRNARLALKSTRAWLSGYGWTLLALIGIGSLMIVLWGVWVLF
jgi:uncharacterized protein YqgC (DUF456 family)